jgi:hypothetical protein
MRHGLVTGGGILVMAMAGNAAAQAVTADDYARAERLLPQNAQLRWTTCCPRQAGAVMRCYMSKAPTAAHG